MLLIKSISIISLILTLILVIALIIFINQVILNKKLTRGNNSMNTINDNFNSAVTLNPTKDLINRHNGRFEVQYSPQGDVVYYMKLPSEDIKNESADCVTLPEPKIQETLLEKMSAPDLNKEVRIDHKFLDKVTSVIYSDITNTENLIDILSSELCLSASQLNRKIKLMSGMTTSRFILKTRLNRARKLLSTTQRQIGDVAMDCGFNDFAYFSRSFKKEFDMTPTTYQRLQHSIN